jgi:hypothetical protein
MLAHLPFALASPQAPYASKGKYRAGFVYRKPMSYLRPGIFSFILLQPDVEMCANSSGSLARRTASIHFSGKLGCKADGEAPACHQHCRLNYVRLSWWW